MVRFGIDFGAIWDPFWEPKSVIFGFDFLMIFACCSKIVLRASKSSPRGAKRLPRGSQERPRAAKSGPREAKRRPREPQERPRASQERLKSGKEQQKLTQVVLKECEKITRAVQAK